MSVASAVQPSRPLIRWPYWLIFALSLAASLVIYIAIFFIPAGLVQWLDRPLLSLYHLDLAYPGLQTQMIAAFAALALLNAAGYWAVRRLQGPAAWALVLVGALGFALILLYIYPFGAADIFDNIVHGRILGVYGDNPFLNLAAEYPTDPFYNYMWWHKSPSAYGPLWELLAGLTAFLAGNGLVSNVIAFKLLPGFFWLGSTVLLALTLRRHNPDRALPYTLLWAWNPVVLFETFGNGHNDIVMAFFVLAAGCAMLRRQFVPATLALAAGILIKFVPALLVPPALVAVWRLLPDLRSRLRTFALGGGLSVLLAVACYAPFFTDFDHFYLAHQQTLFTASLPAVLYQMLTTWFHLPGAAAGVTALAWGATGGMVLVQSIRLWHQPSETGFVQAAFAILMFFLLLTCTWFQPWYTLWVFGLGLLLSQESLAAALVLVFATRTKPLLLVPMTYWVRPFPPQPWLEIQLALGILGVPLLFTLVILRFRKMPVEK